MIGPILQHEDLQRLCRPDPAAPAPSLATIERWAKRIGLRYTYDGKGGLLTTINALNAAIGMDTTAANDEKYNPDQVL